MMMTQNVTQKLIVGHLISGQIKQGQEIALKIDQTLTQDATGTLALLEFEAIGVSRVQIEISVLRDVALVDENVVKLYSVLLRLHP
jgi:aconitate hydratase